MTTPKLLPRLDFPICRPLILLEQPNSSQSHIFNLGLICLSNNGIQTSVFQVSMKT